MFPIKLKNGVSIHTQSQVEEMLTKYCKYSSYFWKSENINSFKNNLNIILELASKLSISQLQEVINKCNHDTPWFRSRSSCCELIRGESFRILSGSYFEVVEKSSLDEMNKMRLENVMKFSNFASTAKHSVKPSILTIVISNDSSCIQGIHYYGDAIKHLEDFTPKLFIESAIKHQFNFFRFCKNPEIPRKRRRRYDRHYDDFIPTTYNFSNFKDTDCNEMEVFDVLDKTKRTGQNSRLFLLIFFMSSYFKNYIFKAVKSAIQYVSDIDNDVLSVVMEYITTYHQCLNNLFDKRFIKILLLEASQSSECWQDLLEEIIRDDEDLYELYTPRITKYHDSEKLNLLNMEIHQKLFGKLRIAKWLSNSIDFDHMNVFKILINKHIANDDKSVWLHIFRKISYTDFQKQDKYFQIVKQKIVELKKHLCKKGLKRFDALYENWVNNNFL